MAQQNLRRSLAVFTFATFAALSPLADLHAAPVRQSRKESGDEARSEWRLNFPMWKSMQRFFEKIGARIDGNGLTFAAPVDNGTGTEKIGARIDGNG
ncbi:MAG TPA: hypothetical protein VJ725_10505 [Thermoanaerobaculia bacterium]|nr:hypothetical protein [Thermoanaerobaculia bacterium]